MRCSCGSTEVVRRKSAWSPFDGHPFRDGCLLDRGLLPWNRAFRLWLSVRNQRRQVHGLNRSLNRVAFVICIHCIPWTCGLSGSLPRFPDGACHQTQMTLVTRTCASNHVSTYILYHIVHSADMERTGGQQKTSKSTCPPASLARPPWMVCLEHSGRASAQQATPPPLQRSGLQWRPSATRKLGF